MAVEITNRIAGTPTRGKFYTIVSGDTLLGVAGKAFGAKSGTSERLEAARVINGSSYNDRFRGGASNLFPEGQLSFNPRFVKDPNAQAAATGGACPKGHSFATLWIPRHTGDEPNLNVRVDFFPLNFDLEEDSTEYLDPTLYHLGEELFRYKVQTGDTLESIADALDMEWQDLAIMNFGTDDVEEINHYLETHFVCQQKEGENYVFTSEDDPGILLLPRIPDPNMLRRRRILRASRFQRRG